MEAKREAYIKQKADEEIKQKVMEAEEYQKAVEAGTIPQGMGGPECFKCSQKQQENQIRMKMGLPPKEAPEPLALPTGSVSCGCKS
jgi:hypothetical protein